MNEMRRKDKLMEEKLAYEVLKNCNFAVLSTINADDNTPYAIPISPALSDDVIYFHCAQSGQKIDNINKNNNVCLTCAENVKQIPEKFTTQFQSVVVTGTVLNINNHDEKILALRKICEKYAASNMGNFEKEIEKSLSHTAIYKINIKSISGKGNITNI